MLPIIKLNYSSKNNHKESCNWLLNHSTFQRVRTKCSKDDDWSGLSLIGYSSDPMNLDKPKVLGSKIKSSNITQTGLFNLKIMKSVISIVKDIEKKYQTSFERVRLLKLKADKIIKKHTDKIDKDFGYEIGKLVRLHLPIRTNKDVYFSIWNKSKCIDDNLELNQLYYVDVTKPHSVRNQSKEDRIHLVLDCILTESLMNELKGVSSL